MALRFFILAAVLICFSRASFAEINGLGGIAPEAPKVGEEIDDDRNSWLGKGIAACTVDDRLLEKDANTMGYYYSQKLEHRHSYKKNYDIAVAKYRAIKLECLQKVITREFGEHLQLKTALIFSDFREAMSRLKSWGVYFQQQQMPVCPYEQEKMNQCTEFMTRQQKDAQIGWAMERLADDIGAQVKLSTTIELGEAFARANRNLPKK